MSALRLYIVLIIAVLCTATIAEGRTPASEQLLVGRWVSPQESLVFFASREFTYGGEHGPAGSWSLRGRHLTFGIPKRSVRREASIVQLTHDRLILLTDGKKHFYRRVDHY
jgi:hypothetical protein